MMVAEEQEKQRRSEDRDRELNARLDTLERSHQDLSSNVRLMQAEQLHLKEIFATRLQIIEKGQELAMSEMRQIAKDIQNMGNDPKYTPMGRSLTDDIQQLEATISEQGEKIHKHAAIHQHLLTWQDRVDTVLSILKWIGAAGLVGLALSILRLVKVIP